MNLEWAMYELTKNPQAVICSDGQCRPALRYSRGLDRAIRWLVDRYTDGTLKVEGYVPKHNEIKRTSPPERTRGKIINGQYLTLLQFVKQSGFSYKETVAIGKMAGAYVQGRTHGCHSYIDVIAFYDFLNAQKKFFQNDNFMNLSQAVKMSGIPKKELKELLFSGKIECKLNTYPDPKVRGTEYKISYNSLLRYMKRREKGENNGEDNTVDGEVCGE